MINRYNNVNYTTAGHAKCLKSHEKWSKYEMDFMVLSLEGLIISLINHICFVLKLVNICQHHQCLVGTFTH